MCSSFCPDLNPGEQKINLHFWIVLGGTWALFALLPPSNPIKESRTFLPVTPRQTWLAAIVSNVHMECKSNVLQSAGDNASHKQVVNLAWQQRIPGVRLLHRLGYLGEGLVKVLMRTESIFPSDFSRCRDVQRIWQLWTRDLTKNKREIL